MNGYTPVLGEPVIDEIHEFPEILEPGGLEVVDGYVLHYKAFIFPGIFLFLEVHYYADPLPSQEFEVVLEAAELPRPFHTRNHTLDYP